MYSTQCYNCSVRVFKTKPFARWCTLTDDVLGAVALEIEAGQYEADLGKGVIKKRIAYPGRGKRGSARLLVAKRVRGSIIFLVGRDKSDPGADFSDAQIAAAKELAAVYERLTPAQIQRVVQHGELKEIAHGGAKNPES